MDARRNIRRTTYHRKETRQRVIRSDSNRMPGLRKKGVATSRKTVILPQSLADYGATAKFRSDSSQTLLFGSKRLFQNLFNANFQLHRIEGLDDIIFGPGLGNTPNPLRSTGSSLESITIRMPPNNSLPLMKWRNSSPLMSGIRISEIINPWQIASLHLLEHRFRAVEIATVVLRPRQAMMILPIMSPVIDNEYFLLVHISNVFYLLKLEIPFAQTVHFLLQPE